MILLPVLAMLVSPQEAAAADKAPPDRFALSRLVTETAFDPARYSDQPAADIVRIVYRGDDYGWPVFAIAVSDTCAPVGGGAGGCTRRTIARMVRGAWTGGKAPERARWRGQALVNGLAEKGVLTREAIGPALDTGAAEWLEADVDRCAGARQTLAEAVKASWVSSERLAPTGSDQLAIVLHADTVRVEFVEYLRSAIYDGYIAKDSPAAWADAFARKLEPCWKPSAAPPPWRKQAAAGQKR